MKAVLRLLSLLSLLFLFALLYYADLWALLDQITPSFLLAIAAGTLLITAGWFAQAQAWSNLIEQNQPAQLPRRRRKILFGLTQIQKYLPGNVFHFLIRHLQARQEGERHEALFWATVGEILGQLLAAAIIIALFLSLFLSVPHALSFGLLLLLLSAILLITIRILPDLIGLLVPLLLKTLGEKGRRWSEAIDLNTPGLTARALLQTLPHYGLFFALMGIALLILAIALTPLPPPLILLTFALASLGWMVGFLLPGAPGGLGPREAVLTAGFGPFIGLESALLIAFGLRVATILADLLFYLLSLLLHHRHPPRDAHP